MSGGRRDPAGRAGRARGRAGGAGSGARGAAEAAEPPRCPRGGGGRGREGSGGRCGTCARRDAGAPRGGEERVEDAREAGWRRTLHPLGGFFNLCIWKMLPRKCRLAPAAGSAMLRELGAFKVSAEVLALLRPQSSCRARSAKLSELGLEELTPELVPSLEMAICELFF